MIKAYSIIFIYALCQLIQQTAHAQQTLPSIKLSTGFGYYDPSRTGETGNLFFSRLLFKLPTGLYVGGEIATSLVFNTFDEFGSLAGERTYNNYYLYSLHVEKPFFLDAKKNHELSLSSGLIYVERKVAEVAFEDGAEPGTITPFISRTSINSNEGGSFLEVNYSYHFPKLSLGLKARTHALLGIGLGELILSPTIMLRL
ncbi:MAG: hypothetical protein AAFW89_12280 [Bacteroidota bacterium]